MLAAEFLNHMFGCGFDGIDPIHIQKVLDYTARNFTPIECWGRYYMDGTAALSAHLMSLQLAEFSQRGAQGANSAEGKTYTPRAPLAQTDDDTLRLSMEGNEFLRLRDLVVGMTMATNVYGLYGGTYA